MSDDIIIESVVIYATTPIGGIQYIKEDTAGNYVLLPGLKGAATFTLPMAEKFIRLAGLSHIKLNTQAVK